MGDQPTLNRADIEAITVAFSTALNTANANLANQIGGNLADRIGALINRRPRRDRPVNPPLRGNRPHTTTSSSSESEYEEDVNPPRRDPDY